ncbi:MAG: YceI family protein [Bacteroidota bacterium]
MVHQLALWVAAAVAAATPASSQIVWKLDKAHSSIKFSVAHLVISEVTGVFRDFDVSLTAGAEDFSDATLTVTVKAASISTDNERRDNHLKSEDFLDAEHFPEITFKSTSVEKTGENIYRIPGDLTIRGITRPVVLTAERKGIVEMRGRTIVAFSASTEINRFDYDVRWDAKIETGGLIAGDKVKIEITYEGIRQ